MQVDQELYPIREVAQITGVNAITLRAWERRYGLITPVRTDGGHRLYTQQHIDFIKAAVELTNQGVPISRVKNLLKKRFSEPAEQPLVMQADGLNERLLQCALDRDCETLQAELDRLFSELSEDMVYRTLMQVDALLKNQTESAYLLWRSELLPRLQSRISQSKRYSLDNETPKVWLENLSDQGELALLIGALKMLARGYYPIWVSSSNHKDNAFKGLKPVLQELGVSALTIVAQGNASEFDHGFWQQWQNQNPDIEVIYLEQIQ